jgi:hypothetical protein
MAIQMNEKRKALVDAVKKDLRPFILQLGFELDRRPPDERSWRWRQGAFLRRRDGRTDELSIQWEKYDAPLFILNFWTDDAERMQVANRHLPSRGPDSPARIYPIKRSVFAVWGGTPWFGRGMTVEQTIQVARTRLGDLDHFLRTGSPTIHLDWRKGRN